MYTSNGINQLGQQRINRALVIDLLRREGVCTRAKLAKLSNLKRATITNIINEFIACGLVVEAGVLIGHNNRRTVGIKINGSRFRIIGVMLAKTHYSMLLISLTGEPQKINHRPINYDRGPQGILCDIKNDIQEMIDKAGDEKVLAIGLAMSAMYERGNKRIINISNLPNWEGIPIYEELLNSFPMPVFIENDANAGAYAQTWHHGGSGFENLAYILAGEGIGCGIISESEILHGEMGLAGEIGHTIIRFDGKPCECGSRGCLEAYCSTISLKKKLHECINNGEKTVLAPDFSWEEVVRAVREGDGLALREYKAACRCLSIGIINIINLLNPGVIIIGDQLAEIQQELMLETVNDCVRRSIRPIIWKKLRIEVNTLDTNPVLLGASTIAAREIFKDPYKYIKN